MKKLRDDRNRQSMEDNKHLVARFVTSRSGQLVKQELFITLRVQVRINERIVIHRLPVNSVEDTVIILNNSPCRQIALGMEKARSAYVASLPPPPPDPLSNISIPRGMTKYLPTAYVVREEVIFSLCVSVHTQGWVLHPRSMWGGGYPIPGPGGGVPHLRSRWGGVPWQGGPLPGVPPHPDLGGEPAQSTPPI